MNNIIVPQRAKCNCGKSVNNHHWLCDKCYGIKTKNNQILLEILKKREDKLIRKKNKIIKELREKLQEIK